MQLDKQVITMEATTRMDKPLTPTVPEWLSNAANDTSTYLNMSTSDFAILCWCIGVTKAFSPSEIPSEVKSEVDTMLERFGHEIEFYSKRISELEIQME